MHTFQLKPGSIPGSRKIKTPRLWRGVERGIINGNEIEEKATAEDRAKKGPHKRGTDSDHKGENEGKYMMQKRFSTEKEYLEYKEKLAERRREELQITLKAARVNAGMMQTEVAKELGVLRDTIGRWENGQTKPRADQLAKMSELYNIPIENIKV